MSVISYTDVCFIDVAAEPFAAAVRVQQAGEDEVGSSQECYLYKMS